MRILLGMKKNGTEMEEKMKEKLFTKDFTIMIIGQIISLFGNGTIRFALPLYLLNQTGSSALYGMVTAFAFLPAIFFSPIGGIVADRINKRNIMVILDFFTSFVIFIFSLLMNRVSLVFLITITLMLLYSIAGAYQPSVQSSIPSLVNENHLMIANSIVNTISSFASFLGPVLGGILYSAYGLKIVLFLCIICFFLSAVMEMFMEIPFIKQNSSQHIWKIVKEDFTKSIHFIRKDKPAIGKVLLIICSINLFLSSMIVVGMPYMITEVLDLGGSEGNKLYGFAQGILAVGGLAGGISAGIFANKLEIQKSGNLIIACSICVFPIGASLFLFSSGFLNYIIMTGCCFIILAISAIFTVQMMAFVQRETPQSFIGKVIAVIFTVSMCAQPLGNAFYGTLFEICKGFEYSVILFSGFVSLFIAICTRNIFRNLSPNKE